MLKIIQSHVLVPLSCTKIEHLCLPDPLSLFYSNFDLTTPATRAGALAWFSLIIWCMSPC